MTPLRVPRRKTAKPRRKKLNLLNDKDLGEFSKRVVVAVVRVWLFGVIYGALIIAVQVIRSDYMTDLSSWLMFVGSVPVTAVLGYAGKYIFENPLKIKQAIKDGTYDTGGITQQPPDNPYIP